MINAMGELVPVETKPRSCLRCDRSFQSYGKHNRLCERCQDSAGLFTYAAYPSALADREVGGITYHRKKRK